MPDSTAPESLRKSDQADEDDDEPDEWYVSQRLRQRSHSQRSRDKRIFSTGCSG